jgi:hypothetical protein
VGGRDGVCDAVWLIDALDSQRPFLQGATTFLHFAMLSAAVLRWG